MFFFSKHIREWILIAFCAKVEQSQCNSIVLNVYFMVVVVFFPKRGENKQIFIYKSAPFVVVVVVIVSGVVAKQIGLWELRFSIVSCLLTIDL